MDRGVTQTFFKQPIKISTLTSSRWSLKQILSCFLQSRNFIVLIWIVRDFCGGNWTRSPFDSETAGTLSFSLPCHWLYLAFTFRIVVDCVRIQVATKIDPTTTIKQLYRCSFVYVHVVRWKFVNYTDILNMDV